VYARLLAELALEARTGRQRRQQMRSSWQAEQKAKDAQDAALKEERETIEAERTAAMEEREAKEADEKAGRELAEAEDRGGGCAASETYYLLHLGPEPEMPLK
jgi:hypothetical protein